MEYTKLQELTKDLTSDELILLLEIITDDIKFNRIKYNKITTDNEFCDILKTALRII